MLFAVICRDKPGALDVRMGTRPAHLAYLERLDGEGRLKLAGPTLDAAGDPDGSLIVVEAEDRAGAEAIVAQDPYAQAGLFAAVEIRPFRWVFNNPDA